MIEIADYLTIIEIVVAVLLIASILIQNKQVSLNLTTMWGWMGEVTKRWADKVLHNLTVFLGTAFIFISIALFLLK